MIKAILLTLLTSSCQSAKLVELDLHAKHQAIQNNPHEVIQLLKNDKYAHKVAGLDALYQNFGQSAPSNNTDPTGTSKKIEKPKQAIPEIKSVPTKAIDLKKVSTPSTITKQVTSQVASKQPPAPPGDAQAPGMGVVKSAGKRKANGIPGQPEGTNPADNVNKDIYFEKDFGNAKEKRRTSLNKDDDLGHDEHHESNNPFDDGPAYEGRPEIKDDKRSNKLTVKKPLNPDINPDPKALPFYNAPPPPPPTIVTNTTIIKSNITNSTVESNVTKTNSTTANTTAPPPPKKKREFVNMTLSKLTYDNDSWVENNDKYHYRNMKMATSRMIQNKTYGSMYYVRMNIGSPPQVQEMLVDTASSWSYVDSYDASGPERSLNYYLLSEERDGSLDCGDAAVVTIGNGRGRGVTGPACQDNMSVQGAPQLTANLPIVVRRGESGEGPFAGGVLGLGPVDDSGAGASFVNYLFDQGKIDANLFSVLPGKEPKITFGGYQEEGLPAPEQRFYSEVMHEMIAIKNSAGPGWSLPLLNVNIGKTDFVPKARSAQLDAGSGMIIFGKQDYKIVADSICDFVQAMRTRMSCIGRSDNAEDYGAIQLVNATRELVMELPHIKFQFDQYNFDLRPERYFSYADTTPPPVNTTKPYPKPQNLTSEQGHPVEGPQLSTGGRLFGKISTDMLTRGDKTTNVTDPESYYFEYNGTSNCTNGTVWNGTGCGNRTESNITFAERGVATFLIFPQRDSGQDTIILGAPFLDDYYQVYNLDKNVIGLVPSVDTNPETSNGYYSSSKPENIHEQVDRPTIIWLSVIGLFLGAVFRNGLFQVCYAGAFAAIASPAPKGYAALEGGEIEEDD